MTPAPPPAPNAPLAAPRPEADPLVGPDRGAVVHGRVDRQPMVAARVDEVRRQHRDRLRAQSLPLVPLAEIEVDARVPVVALVLLVELDRPGDLSADLDDEDDL